MTVLYQYVAPAMVLVFGVALPGWLVLRAILEDRADGGMMVPPENTILESLSEKLNRLRPADGAEGH